MENVSSLCFLCQNGTNYIYSRYYKKKICNKVVKVTKPDLKIKLKSHAETLNDQRIIQIFNDQDIYYHNNCKFEFLNTKNEPAIEIEEHFFSSGHSTSSASFMSSGCSNIEESILITHFMSFKTDYLDKVLGLHLKLINLNHLTSIFNEKYMGKNNMPVIDHSKLKCLLSMEELNGEYSFLQLYRNQHDYVCSSNFCDLECFGRKLVENEEEILSSQSSSTSSSYLTSEELAVVPKKKLKSIYTLDDGKNLYHSALLIKNLINDIPDVSLGKWPPKLKELDLSSFKKFVPHLLYNFILLIFERSKIFEDFSLNTKLECKENLNIRILSIIQDLVYCFNDGKKQTPKHLSLALTVYHDTRSKKILDLLHSLGHCSSYSKTIALDTAFAEAKVIASNNMNKSTFVPPNLLHCSPTIFVYDNNDFNEETKSGHGTTHATSGLVIQNLELNSSFIKNSQSSCTSSDYSSQERIVVNKKKRKLETIQPPLKDISIQHGKEGPKFLKTTVSKFIEEIYVELYDNNEYKVQNMELLLLLNNAYSTNKNKSWKLFNSEFSQTINITSKIHFLPMLNYPPTLDKVVDHLLKNTIDMADELSLQNIFIVFDLAIYKKAQNLRWQNQLYKQKLLPLLGGFHFSCAFLSCIGRKFNLSGLEDILINNKIVAENSMNGVLSGKHYNRSMKAHLLLYEVLQTLRFRAFINFIKEDSELTSTVELFDEIVDNINANELKNIISSKDEKFNILKVAYQKFINMKSNQNKTFSYYSSYIVCINLLLNFQKATYENNLDDHLSAVVQMIPLFFSYNSYNYARYATSYWCELKELSYNDKEAFQNLKLAWTVKQNDGQFNCLPPDLVMEQTINKDSKTKGGIKQFSRNQGAVDRFMISFADRCEIKSRLYHFAHCSTATNDLTSSSKYKYDNRIQLVIDYVERNINPFSNEWNDFDILNIQSGCSVPQEKSIDILNCLEIGKKKLLNFIQNRFFDKSELWSSKIKNVLSTDFESSKTSSKTKREALLAKELDTLKTEKKLIANLLILAKQKNVDMTEILEYPIFTVPLCIGNEDSSIRKTNKSALKNIILNDYPEVCVKDLTNTRNATLIIDMMMLLHKIEPRNNTSLKEYIYSLFCYIKHLGQLHNVSSVHCIFDNYEVNQLSIKNVERIRRKEGLHHQVFSSLNLSTSMEMDWKKFLLETENKILLLKFITSEFLTFTLSSNMNESIFQFIFNINENCFLMNHEKCTVLPELKNENEEADTVLIFHAFYSDKCNEASIIIYSEDTDVFVLALAFADKFRNKLLIMSGSASAYRYIDIMTLKEKVGKNFCSAVIGMHGFSGCDSTSSFFNIGKKKVLDAVLHNDEFLNLLSFLGNECSINKERKIQFEKLICHLYGFQDYININEVRHLVFMKKQILNAYLPPNQNSFHLHLERVNYQCLIWKKCLQSVVEITSPIEHGWKMDIDKNLVVEWSTMPLRPDKLLNLTKCSCKSNCISNRCSCRKNKLLCSAFCNCHYNCLNKELCNLDGSEDEDECYNFDFDS